MVGELAVSDLGEDALGRRVIPEGAPGLVVPAEVLAVPLVLADRVREGEEGARAMYQLPGDQPAILR